MKKKLTVLSPFLGAEAFLGNRMSLERYSFRRCTLAWRDSVDLLRRRGSTEMPMVRAVFLWMPAACRDEHQTSGVKDKRKFLFGFHCLTRCLYNLVSILNKQSSEKGFKVFIKKIQRFRRFVIIWPLQHNTHETVFIFLNVSVGHWLNARCFMCYTLWTEFHMKLRSQISVFTPLTMCACIHRYLKYSKSENWFWLMSIVAFTRGNCTYSNEY